MFQIVLLARALFKEAEMIINNVIVWNPDNPGKTFFMHVEINSLYAVRSPPTILRTRFSTLLQLSVYCLRADVSYFLCCRKLFV